MNLSPDRPGLLSLSVEWRPPPPALASGLPCALPWTGCSASDAVTALSPSLRDLRDLACICSILWDPAW
uniref:Zinc finger RNA binding protein 2 n=1 Tax=Macaca nemestrina TaxID=9545 RepID=A0A2K6E1B1_MACNE